MSEAFIEFLKGFEMLTEDEIGLIADHSDIRNFSKGTVLLREGEVAINCYSVIRGCVREYHMVDGDERTTGIYTEGQPVNAFTSASNQIASKHFLVCAEDCLLAVGDEALEQKMCKLIPRLESIIRSEVEKETGKMQDHLARFMTSSPEERYLHLLETRPDLFNRLPQHQIASYLGIKPESLSRIRKRIISKERS